MDQFNDVMNRLGQTKKVEGKDPFIGAGQHEPLILLSLAPFTDKKLGEFNALMGYSVRAQFVVEKSTCHAPGSTVTKIWNLFKPAKFETQASDADQFAQFVCLLQGLPEGKVDPAVWNTLLKPRAEGGNLESQPARGARISCTGIEVGKPNEKTGKRYVKTQWKPYPQDAGMIQQMRAHLDQHMPYKPYVQQPAQQQVAQTFGQQVMQPQAYQNAPQQAAPLFGAAPAPVQTAPANGFLSLLPVKP